MALSNKVALYNLTDIKNATDEAVAEYLNSLKFKQSHYYINVRLALGYAAFFLAAACFLWDYYLGWDATKQWTQLAVILYVGLSWKLSSWIQQSERGTIYCGNAQSGEKMLISSSISKHVPVYKVEVVVGDEARSAKAKPGKPKTFTFERPFASWFDETGHMVARPLQEAFATEIPIIGRYDPKRVITSSQAELAQNPELLEAVSQGVSSTSTGSAKKDGGKRRKA